MIKVTFFGGEHCQICHAFRPKVEVLCEQKGFEFEFMDADEDESIDILAHYGARSIPYVVVTEGGEDMFAGIAAVVLDSLKAL